MNKTVGPFLALCILGSLLCYSAYKDIEKKPTDPVVQKLLIERDDLAVLNRNMQKQFDSINDRLNSIQVTNEANHKFLLKHYTSSEVKEIKADINSIYEAMVNYNKHEYLILDKLIRIGHYTTPHKEKVIGCPICSQK